MPERQAASLLLPELTMEERLQKIIAAAGIASRRGAEKIIVEGRVKVNGHKVSTLGMKANPERDVIEIDGNVIVLPEEHTYIVLYKPKGYVTTLHDPQGRPKVTDLLTGVSERVYPVGRLDFNTEGILILTNDGNLANFLQHPRYRVLRRYLVKVKGFPSRGKIEKLQEGRMSKGIKKSSARIKFVKKAVKNTWYEVTLWEGKNRQIVKMFAHIGCSVLRIIRIQFGLITLEGLSPGSFRYLTKREIKNLKNSLTSPN